ncbi:MAG TPA: CoA-binding protein [Flavobacteriales bacterium]|jgi:hypothetical protein|nr:CoA-binding protein [Flavobacteriales bacterium]
MEQRLTLVLGASLNEARYSNLAVKTLRAHAQPVLAVGLREGVIGDTPIVKDIPAGTQVHTVTLYLNAANQERWIDRILALKPARIIFNPGAENPELADRAAAAGIAVEEACTLVMLRTGQY